MLYIVSFFIIFTLIALFITRKKIYVPSSAMAAVMSLGITIQGVLFHFADDIVDPTIFSKLITMLIVSIWFVFFYSYLLAGFQRKFIALYYSNPINRFGIGTWIAGTSISTILFSKQFESISFIAELVTYMNILLWLGYIAISVIAFKEIIQQNLIKNVHGILLLTTVSTQSIVLLLHTIFQHIPIFITYSLISTGILFYILSAVLILNRYIRNKWKIEQDWNNTNCILHGALSISGLACVVSNVITMNLILALWYLVLFVFLVVESFEIVRMIKRIKQYGWGKGIFTYEISQWSRIFTFAMFYTFTSLLESHSVIQHMIIQYGTVIIFTILILEIALSFKNISKNNKHTTFKKKNYNITSLS
ncbi:hypothetical protein [Salirhabdus sp. Marseille-P4669]|uniref:hypothetical protein n=1 Tax=Salirhabdus sp. Marseille-P4669 TaxID=2042310 RepID=UPI000C7D6A9C|nr:hypothetical protein [Salirhabdus sp. Marseille-P4669]